MKSLKIALAALVGLVAVSCYNDFDTPAPQKLYTVDDMAAMGLTPISIKEVKEKELNDMQTRTREFQERAQRITRRNRTNCSPRSSTRRKAPSTR